MNRTAARKHRSADASYEPNGRSAITNALRAAPDTARTSGSSSPTVTGSDDVFPKILFDAESLISSTGIPTSPNVAVTYMPYTVSIAHFSPRSFTSRW
ncbi:hypothetical protein GCM10010358_77680 [Streptomyces minutiscleroticus]|uniref:Uncharacterized protein n=1 Tax=Streptomyces minutiscleroticus TaxID=68238 RepID=A0A918P275_9ACTN|nr:hypothetical protein [Streptomyces minutiscleroticus]GGY13916.1 hypothetical protein GCM10010358_77680 [Streptomyces minutiscleroticus]